MTDTELVKSLRNQEHPVYALEAAGRIEALAASRVLDLDINEYRLAPSGEGELADTWRDKPHRLVYDLCKLAQAERNRANEAESASLAATKRAERTEAIVAQLQDFVTRERALLGPRTGMDVGYAPSINPSVLRVLEDMLRDAPHVAAAYDKLRKDNYRLTIELSAERQKGES